MSGIILWGGHRFSGEILLGLSSLVVGPGGGVIACPIASRGLGARGAFLGGY